ncbi:MAG TPA: hypothetical protein VNM14_06395 [Planctomycetota bacterium]|nr:hypothetical protein [Planctomycetota bacterium]
MSLRLCGQSAPQEDKVAPLARDLESAEVRKIYHAVSDLAALGEPALPAIEKRAQDAKGRTRDYLNLVSEEIRSARLTTGVPPVQRLSMKASDRNVVELLGDLRAKTGVALSLENLMGEEKLPEVPVEVRDVTMLEAFDAICRAGNVTVTMENGQFMLYQGDYQEMPRFFYDHYFFRLGNFVLLRTVDFRKPAVQSFKLQMEMLWDPAAAPCKFNPPVVVEAVDDKGKNLIPPPPPVRKDPPKPVEPKPPGEAEEVEAESTSFLQLLPPSPASEKLTMLRGYTTIGLPKTKVTLSFAEEPKKSERKEPAPPPEKSQDLPAEPPPSPLDGQQRKSGDFTVKIIKVESGLFRVTCEVSSATLKVEDIGKMPFLASVTLKGAEPTRSYVSLWSMKDTVAEVMISFQPLHLKEILVKAGDDRPAPPSPVEKIELSIVTAVQERKIPFEFRDVKIK